MRNQHLFVFCVAYSTYRAVGLLTSSVHGSAQRLKQGLELQRCAIGQPHLVDMAARTLQI
jgi:hypothetical protein